MEICIDSYIIDSDKALIMTTFLCDSRTKKYYINLPLVVDTHQDRGGAGSGTLRTRASGMLLLSMTCTTRAEQRELKAYKARVDPNNILNPGKFFCFRLKRDLHPDLSSGRFRPFHAAHGADGAGDRQSCHHRSWERIRRSIVWTTNSAFMPAPNAETAWRYVRPILSPGMKP